MLAQAMYRRPEQIRPKVGLILSASCYILCNRQHKNRPQQVLEAPATAQAIESLPAHLPGHAGRQDPLREDPTVDASTQPLQQGRHLTLASSGGARWLPTRADLDAATARTAAAIASPSASLADVERAAELEEAAFAAYLQRPEAAAELEAGI
jgi:hypothetical protein